MHYIHLECELIVRITDLAVLVVLDDEEVWIPRSQVEGGADDLDEGDEDVEIGVAEWFAEKEGLV